MARHLSVRTWEANPEPTQLRAPASYDLIFVGSVITHLSPRDSFHLLETLYSWLRPHGLLVVTSHGRAAARSFSAGEMTGTPPEEIYAAAVADYKSAGFGYHNYVGRESYGLSVIALDWFITWAHDASL